MTATEKLNVSYCAPMGMPHNCRRQVMGSVISTTKFKKLPVIAILLVKEMREKKF